MLAQVALSWSAFRGESISVGQAVSRDLRGCKPTCVYLWLEARQIAFKFRRLRDFLPYPRPRSGGFAPRAQGCCLISGQSSAASAGRAAGPIPLRAIVAQI